MLGSQRSTPRLEIEGDSRGINRVNVVGKGKLVYSEDHPSTTFINILNYSVLKTDLRDMFSLFR